MTNATITKELAIELTPKELAQAFCELSNAEQADFFDEVALLAESWRTNGLMMVHMIGRQLARPGYGRALELVKDLVEAAGIGGGR